MFIFAQDTFGEQDKVANSGFDADPATLEPPPSFARPNFGSPARAPFKKTNASAIPPFLNQDYRLFSKPHGNTNDQQAAIGQNYSENLDSKFAQPKEDNFFDCSDHETVAPLGKATGISLFQNKPNQETKKPVINPYAQQKTPTPPFRRLAHESDLELPNPPSCKVDKKTLKYKTFKRPKTAIPTRRRSTSAPARVDSERKEAKAVDETLREPCRHPMTKHPKYEIPDHIIIRRNGKRVDGTGEPWKSHVKAPEDQIQPADNSKPSAKTSNPKGKSSTDEFDYDSLDDLDLEGNAELWKFFQGK